MVFNASFNNISVILWHFFCVEKTEVIKMMCYTIKNAICEQWNKVT